MSHTPRPDAPTVYEQAGGLDAFVALVDDFYDRVAGDEVLRAIYPDDLEPARRHLALFLAQYWGGGDVYSRERGHPRLRMRHAPFAITHDAALRWAQHMAAAIRAQDLPAEVEQALLAYVSRFAPTMINTAEEPDGQIAIVEDDRGR